MTLQQYLRVLIKRRYWLVAGLLAGLAAGVYAVSTSQETYRGSVTFFVHSVDEGTVASANVGDQFAQRRVNTYVALLRADRLSELIVEDLETSRSAGSVRSSISGTADIDTVLLTARVFDDSRAEALAIAESLAQRFPDFVAELERPEEGEPTVRLEVVSGPGVGVVPVRTNMVLATRVVAGLCVALALVVLRELTDDRLHTIDHALLMANMPLLGVVSDDRRASRAPLINSTAPGSFRAEEYRQIRTSLQLVDLESRAKVIVVTSSVPAELKSSTATNLAIAMAWSGQRVALVDADLRKPTVGTLLGLEQSVGLVDTLRGRAALDDVLQRWGEMDLAVLPAGGTTSIPSELLGRPSAAALINDLRSRFDVVIVDSPPLIPVTDATILSTLADGVVLVVRPNKVTKAQLRRSLAILERVQANVLGIVGTMISKSSEPYYGAYMSDAEPDPDELRGTASASLDHVRRAGSTDRSGRTRRERRRRPAR